MNARYMADRSHNKKNDVTMEYRYRVDKYFVTINTQLGELNSSFNEHVVKVLTFTAALDPKRLLQVI